MTAKQKWVMIVGYVIVWTIIILNFMFKPSTTWLIIQAVILLTVQIYGMKTMKNKKSDSN